MSRCNDPLLLKRMDDLRKSDDYKPSVGDFRVMPDHDGERFMIASDHEDEGEIVEVYPIRKLDHLHCSISYASPAELANADLIAEAFAVYRKYHLKPEDCMKHIANVAVERDKWRDYAIAVRKNFDDLMKSYEDFHTKIEEIFGIKEG